MADDTFMNHIRRKMETMDECELNAYIMKCTPYITAYVNCKDDEDVENIPGLGVKVFKSVQKRRIYNDYLRDVEDQEIPQEYTSLSQEMCKKCGCTELAYCDASSNSICKSCGTCEFILGEELTYKEERESTEKVIGNAYKRDNHLNEWILQFQGQETTNIPPEVLDKLRGEFKKTRIKNVEEITQAKVKQFLRKLRLTKYYEHATYITNCLNGISPPKMPRILDNKLRLMFRDIQAPFEKHCPAHRSNFLSYSYVLYKFCELLGEDDFLPYFPLLKSTEKLRQQDAIWKNICNELSWEFIPTA